MRYGAKVLEMGDLEQLFLTIDGHRRRAQIENELFLKHGMMPDVEEDDDHPQHMQEHLRFKVTDDYEQMSPVQKMMFNTHLAKHRVFMAQLLQAQMAMQAMAGGGGSKARPLGQPSAPRQAQPTPGKMQVA
jgi:hypothetical protein